MTRENDKREYSPVRLTSLETFESEEELEKELKRLLDLEAKLFPPVNDKIEAGILGFAVADALGVPIEFRDREALQRNPLKEMIGFGSHPVPAGTWSDDTSLMLATIDSICNLKRIDFEHIMKNFSLWVHEAKYTATDELFDIGIATSKAIRNFDHGVKPVHCGVKGIQENGNGSLMRILPFVCFTKANGYSEEERRQIIDQASALTHAHEISKLGCQIYADYVIHLLNEVDKHEAMQLLKEIDYGKYYSPQTVDEYKRILKGDLASLTIDDIKSSGYVVHTLEASIWCALKHDNYEDAVIEAVNLGNDTDTVGAITGSLSGIIYGKNAIPERWSSKLLRKEYVEELSRHFVFSFKRKV